MSMGIERGLPLMTTGAFREAADHVRDWQSHRDPAEGVFFLSMQLALLDWAGAKSTMDQLRGMAPQLGPLLDRVQDSAQAEWERHARLTDPARAGKRAAFSPPPAYCLLYARASAAHAAGDLAGAKETLDMIAQTRPKVAGTITTVRGDEVPFVDIIDMDDLTGAVFPVYYKGVIYDLPFAELRSLEFLPKDGNPFHWLWPSVAFDATTGARGTAAFPALYAGSTTAEMREVRVGSTTTFDHDRGYAMALGQRDFWVFGPGGEKRMMGLGHFAKLRFHPR